MKGLPVLVTWKLVLRWGNPYTKPPEGRGEVLAEARMDQPKGKGAPREHEWPEAFRAAVADGWRPGCGYFICIGLDHAQAHDSRKAWSPERKGEVRRANLKKRIAKQVGPLFAGQVPQLAGEEFAARPEYFAGAPRDELPPRTAP